MHDTHKARVLIVDDQAENIDLLTKMLNQSGYENVEGLTDPRRVLSVFLEHPPDIILLDLNMPELNGFQVMEQLERWTGSDETYLPMLVLTSDTARSSRERSLSMGAKDFLTKPFDHIEVLQRLENLLETRYLHLQLRAQNNVLEEKVHLRTTELWEMVGRLETAHLKIRASQEETVTRLSIAAEFRDAETARHILRMGHYCTLLSSSIGEDESRSELLGIASRLHDVGKIGTPDSILLKPGPLTTQERAVMQEHSEMGYRILARSDSELLQMAASIALTHHERLDGTGYPRNLCEEEIPMEGRIAAIADVFDALTTNRIYRKAMPIEMALEIMGQGSGSQFDPELLSVFFDVMLEVLALKDRLDDLGANSTFLTDEEPPVRIASAQ